MGGGFDAYRANKFTYRMQVEKEGGTATTVEEKQVTDEGRAYHSAYFEMLGEQGYPGFIAWMLLHLSGLWQMERIRRRWRGRESEKEQWQAPLATALQLGHAVYLIASLFIGVAYQPFILMLVGMQCALWLYCKKTDSLGDKSKPRGRNYRGRNGKASSTDSVPDAVTARRPALR